MANLNQTLAGEFVKNQVLGAPRCNYISHLWALESICLVGSQVIPVYGAITLYSGLYHPQITL